MSYAGEGEGVNGASPPRLLDQVRQRLRVKHYSLRTEQAYVVWIRRFVLANDKRHPRQMGGVEVERFLTRLATESNVAAGTQNQALSALLFLYREVLGITCPGWNRWCGRSGRNACRWCCRARKCRGCWRMLDGQTWLMAALLYGTGMRLMECLRLRVKDVDFERNEICVRDGKGGKDRRVPAAARLREAAAARSRARARAPRT